MHLLDADLSIKTLIGSSSNIQVIFEEDPNASRTKQPLSRSASIPVTTGPGLVPYIKPGLRVVRGPDWKWGDQVNRFHKAIDCKTAKKLTFRLYFQ